MCADAVSHFGGTTGNGRNLGGAMGGVGRHPVGQPPATAARCAGGASSGHGRLDRCTLLTAPRTGAPRGPALPGTEKGRGWGVRPADGRSRTLPGTLGEGARHRAGRDRRLYGYLSHYGRSPERMPARKKPRRPVSPRPREFRLRFRDYWPSPNRWRPARGFEKKTGRDCPACPPHSRPSAKCEVLVV